MGFVSDGLDVGNMPKNVHSNGLKVSVALEEVLSLQNFWVRKCKHHFFLKKLSVLRAVFIELKFM